MGRVVTVFILLLGLTSCARRQDSNVIRLGYFANLTHGQALIAVETGEFAAAVAPMTLETRVFNAGPALIEAMNAGEIDVAYVGPGPAVNGFVRGGRVRVLAGSAANGVCLVAAPKSGIRTVDDLRGRRIATPQLGNTQDLTARYFVTAVLGQPDANNVIPVANPEQLTLFRRGGIDAAWTPEPWASRLLAQGGTLIAEERDLWPERRFCLTLLVASPEFARTHGAVIGNILATHTAVTERLRHATATEEALLNKALTRLSGKPLPAALLKSALSRVEFTTDPLESTVQTMAERAFVLGFLPRAPKLDGMFPASALAAGSP